jgi:hypothetical protein
MLNYFVFVSNTITGITPNAARAPASPFFALLTACLVRLDNEKGDRSRELSLSLSEFTWLFRFRYVSGD